MQKWEYLVVAFHEGRARWVNGQELSNWKRVNSFNYLNLLGEQGWELVGITNEPTMGVPRFWAFKRPKE